MFLNNYKTLEKGYGNWEERNDRFKQKITENFSDNNNTDKILLSRYPFVGSHDSAAYEKNNIPHVQTQDLNFLQQYQIGGINFFDIRLTFDIFNNLIFQHGPVALHSVSSDNSLVNLINTCIQNNDFIIFSIKNDLGVGQSNENTEKVLNSWNEYISKISKGRSMMSNFREKYFNEDKTISYYKNKKINILNIGYSDIWGYYDSNFTIINKGNLDFFCNSTSNTYQPLINNINTLYNECKRVFFPNQQLSRIDCFYQSPVSSFDLTRISLCFIDQVKLEAKIKINASILKYITMKEDFFPNILLFNKADDVTNQIKKVLLKRLSCNYNNNICTNECGENNEIENLIKNRSNDFCYSKSSCSKKVYDNDLTNPTIQNLKLNEYCTIPEKISCPTKCNSNSIKYTPWLYNRTRMREERNYSVQNCGSDCKIEPLIQKPCIYSTNTIQCKNIKNSKCYSLISGSDNCPKNQQQQPCDKPKKYSNDTGLCECPSKTTLKINTGKCENL